MGDREIGAILTGRLELERHDLRRESKLAADVHLRHARQASLLTGKDVEADVVEAVPGRILERGRGEVRSLHPIVVRLSRRLAVEPRETGRLAPQLGQRLGSGVVLEEPERDQARDEKGERDRGEEEQRQPDAQRAEHALRLPSSRRPGRCSARARPCSRRPRRSRSARRRRASGGAGGRARPPCGCRRRTYSPTPARAAGLA